MNPRRNKDQWAALIEQQSNSGKTIKAFCQDNDIALASFGKWKHKLSNKRALHSNDSKYDGFTPVQVVDSKDQCSPAKPSTTVTLTLGSNITVTIQSSEITA